MADVSSIKRFVKQLDTLIDEASYDDETSPLADDLQDVRIKLFDNLDESTENIKQSIQDELNSSQSTYSMLSTIGSIVDDELELMEFMEKER